MAFLTLRDGTYTVQLLARVGNEGNWISPQMTKFIASAPLESVVDVEAVVKVPTDRDGKTIEVLSVTQKNVELHIHTFRIVHAAIPRLPVQLRDLMRPDGADGPTVSQDLRLDNRILDLRTPTNQAIMRIKAEFVRLFTERLHAMGGVQVQTPKLIAGASEGGSKPFEVDYFGQPACLAQSPQLHKQQAVMSGFKLVYEVGPVFRAEKSFTHRHLCEFTGLDLEMEFKQHYHEVVHTIGALFMHMFKAIEVECKDQIELVRRQYPSEPPVFSDKLIILTFIEGIDMLKAKGVTNEDGTPLQYEDLSTPNEKLLGELVKQKYGTDFYVLDKFPESARPFYTMPDPSYGFDEKNVPKFTNSYDMFLRGEEITSGAQRIHDVELLTVRARQKLAQWANSEPDQVSLDDLRTYIDAFQYGSVPHAGCGIGLERIAMLYLNLGNIRRVSMFPRDPKRLSP